MKHLIFILLLLGSLYTFTGCGSGGGGSDTSNDNTIVFNEDSILTLEKASFDTYSAPLDVEVFNNFIQDYNRLAIDQYLFAAHNYGTFQLDLNYNLNVTTASFSFYQLLGLTAFGSSSNTAIQFRESFSSLVSPELFIQLRGSLLSDANNQQIFQSTNFFIGQQNYIFLKNYLNGLIQFFDPLFYCHDFTFFGDIFDNTINDLTYGSTKDLLNYSIHFSENDERIRFVRGNTLALSSDWQFPFDNMSSFEGIFEDSSGYQWYVPMIRWQGMFKSYEDDTLDAFELPIGNSNLAMTVFMPKEGSFLTFQDDLHINFPEIISALQPTYREVVLPEFSTSYKGYNFYIEKKNYLEDFMQLRGIALAFDENKADYSAVNGHGYNYLAGLSESVQITLDKTAINVVGAALSTNSATENEPNDVWSNSSDFRISSPRFYIKENVADAFPFLFAIRDINSGAILFLGRVVYIPGGILI